MKNSENQNKMSKNEMADYVKESNRKYDEMIKKKMDLEDSLKERNKKMKDLENKIEELNKKIEDLIKHS